MKELEKINRKALENMHACQDTVNWFAAQGTDDLKTLFDLAVKAQRFSDINWLLTQIMNKKQCAKYAIFAAEQVLPLFEGKFPNDTRPRKAVEATKEYLRDPCTMTKTAANVAAGAVDGAVSVARAGMDTNATWAARSAGAAARATGSSYAGSGYDAVYAANRAAWDNAGTMYTIILPVGFDILTEV